MPKRRIRLGETSQNIVLIAVHPRDMVLYRLLREIRRRRFILVFLVRMVFCFFFYFFFHFAANSAAWTVPGGPTTSQLPIDGLFGGIGGLPRRGGNFGGSSAIYCTAIIFVDFDKKIMNLGQII